MGPFPVSVDGYTYVISFTDAYSRFSCCYFLKTKDEAPSALRSVIDYFKREGFVIKKLRTDQGGEFLGGREKDEAQFKRDAALEKAFAKICGEHGIVHELLLHTDPKFMVWRSAGTRQLCGWQTVCYLPLDCPTFSGLPLLLTQMQYAIDYLSVDLGATRRMSCSSSSAHASGTSKFSDATPTNCFPLIPRCRGRWLASASSLWGSHRTDLGIVVSILSNLDSLLSSNWFLMNNRQRNASMLCANTISAANYSAVVNFTTYRSREMTSTRMIRAGQLHKTPKEEYSTSLHFVPIPEQRGGDD